MNEVVFTGWDLLYAVVNVGLPLGLALGAAFGKWVMQAAYRLPRNGPTHGGSYR